MLRVLEPDHVPLHSLGLTPHANIHVIDTDPNRTVAGLNDLSRVEKVRMDDAEYDKREGRIHDGDVCVCVFVCVCLC